MQSASMVKEGIPFVLLFLIPGLILGFLGYWTGSGLWLLWGGAGLCVLLSAFMAFFFRDPERSTPPDSDVIVSPADGRVLIVERIEPKEANSAVQVSIFLSPLDVHINRSPMAGEIIGFDYRPGAFHIASRRIASVENEQNIVTVRGEKVTIVFRQIAGILARRLVFWKRVGEHVDMGERIGLMKFSSRMDVLMPGEFDVLVKPGDRVTGGVTIIGRLRNSNADQTGE
ncbi:MAG TPA: phosphatidylserine decarboxylase [Blastocatellia bacterium]|nr:phosphatidylserine decarboxylase [Blastocatellia bacterium]